MEKEREFSDFLVRSTMISGVLRTGTLFPIPVQTCLEPAFVLFFYDLVEKHLRLTLGQYSSIAVGHLTAGT